MRRWRSSSVEETRRLGAALAEELAPNGVLMLSGDLGAGKTVLTQGVGQGLGIDPREIQSPSFTLIREHAGERGTLIHVDLYRLAPEDVEALGLDEMLCEPGVKVVEWAGRVPFPVPSALWIELRVVSPQEREIVEQALETSPDLARAPSAAQRSE